MCGGEEGVEVYASRRVVGFGLEKGIQIVLLFVWITLIVSSILMHLILRFALLAQLVFRENHGR